MVVRLKSWRSREWSFGGRVRSSSGPEKVVYSLVGNWAIGGTIELIDRQWEPTERVFF